MAVRRITKPKGVADHYQYARQLLAEGRKEEARDALDTALIKVAETNRVHNDDNYILEGSKVSLWLERLWCTLENHDLLLGGDNEK